MSQSVKQRDGESLSEAFERARDVLGSLSPLEEFYEFLKKDVEEKLSLDSSLDEDSVGEFVESRRKFYRKVVECGNAAEQPKMSPELTTFIRTGRVVE